MNQLTDDIDVEQLTDKIAQLLAKGATLGNVLGYSEQRLEAMYALGHRLYKQGRYSDAVKVFGFLVIHDHMERRYVNAFAACLHMLKRHEEAIRYYTQAASLDLTDPTPLFHVSECLIAQGRTDDARATLDLVMDQCSETEHAAIWRRTTALLGLLGNAAQPKKGNDNDR